MVNFISRDLLIATVINIFLVMKLLARFVTILIFPVFQGSLTCFCDEGYSGDDCSLSSLLTVNRLVEGAHADLSPTPRQSFTVVYCSAEGFILFGGYSTQYGYMNDIWRFRSGVWSQITPSCMYFLYIQHAFCRFHFLVNLFSSVHQYIGHVIFFNAFH